MQSLAVPRVRRVYPALYLAMVLAGFCCYADPALHVRLLTPLTSYDSRATVQFNTVVIAPFQWKGEVRIPAGTIIRGTVSETRRVGLGLVRERASLMLDFQEYELPDGRVFQMKGRLHHIDNAREHVDRDGRVRGILAANGPQSFLGGLWHMPNAERFSRSFVGMTGAGGRIASGLSLGPFGSVGLFLVKCALIRIPDPEIQLRAGTEMFVRVNELPDDSPRFTLPPESTIDPELGSALATAQMHVERPNGEKAADLINIAMLGSEQDVRRAFEASGWVAAEVLTKSSFSRAYKAYSAQQGYATAPVSKLLYDGREPDLVFQKSFNTIEKRHHIRLWAVEYGTSQIWLGAATHDVGIEFRGVRFTHRIHPRIDWERAKVINDLSFAGWTAPPAYVSRPQAVRTSGNGVLTDGRLAILTLQPRCARPVSVREFESGPFRSKFSLIARRMMLEGRQYVLRGNPYYWTYRLANMARRPVPSAGIEE